MFQSRICSNDPVKWEMNTTNFSNTKCAEDWARTYIISLSRKRNPQDMTGTALVRALEVATSELHSPAPNGVRES